MGFVGHNSYGVTHRPPFGVGNYSEEKRNVFVQKIY